MGPILERVAAKPSKPKEATIAPQDEGGAIREWPSLSFRIFTAKNKSVVLAMRTESESMTPSKVIEVWEKSWRVQYAGRIKFVAPPDLGKRWLNMEDVLPCSPTVITLEAA